MPNPTSPDDRSPLWKASRQLIHAAANAQKSNRHDLAYLISAVEDLVWKTAYNDAHSKSVHGEASRVARITAWLDTVRRRVFDRERA